MSLSEALEELSRNPHASADQLDALAARLSAFAATLRAQGQSGYLAQGGMGERIRVNVVAPNGTVKQQIDTGEVA